MSSSLSPWKVDYNDPGTEKDKPGTYQIRVGETDSKIYIDKTSLQIMNRFKEDKGDFEKGVNGEVTGTGKYIIKDYEEMETREERLILRDFFTALYNYLLRQKGLDDLQVPYLEDILLSLYHTGEEDDTQEEAFDGDFFALF